MKLIVDYLRDVYQATVAGWDRFWFTAIDPATLSLIRLLGGGMLLYTHLVWTIGLDDFFGADGWLSQEAVRTYQGSPFTWSYLWIVQSSSAALWMVHLAALVVFACLTVGFFSRTASVLAFLAAVSYVNRVPGSLFGLDQINAMLALYLMVGPCGACYSVDAWLARRRSGKSVAPSVGANIALRLIQLHMCIIYFFAGISKLQGPAWWDGSALWGAVANLEYQSIDMTWMANWPITIAAMTHITVFWELSYPALVWPRLTRPFMLFVAVPLHLGIAIFLGMPTFGIAMLIANGAFVSPSLVRRLIEGQVEPPAAPPEARAETLLGRRRKKSRSGEPAQVS